MDISRGTVIESHNSTKHDGAVAIWCKGKVYALAAERIDRIKHSLDSGVAYLFLRERLKDEIGTKNLYDFFEPNYKPFQEINHHLAHAASAYYPSSFENAAVLVIDGMGPYQDNLFASTSLWHGRKNELKLLKIIKGPYPCFKSLGHFYSSIAWYLGFDFFDSSYAMSLAAFGNRFTYKTVIDKLIWLTKDSFETDPDFIRFTLFERFGKDFRNPPNMVWMNEMRLKYIKMLGPVRSKNECLIQRHFDIAAAAQHKLEQILKDLLNELYNMTGTQNLCYAGGVALNCVANGRTLGDSPFSNVFIQPASDDSGQALGKLLFRLYNEFGLKKRLRIDNTALGPIYNDKDFASAISILRPNDFEIRAFTPSQLINTVSELIAAGYVIGWFQGRSEHGPRALGKRSILADARKIASIGNISDSFKRREWYRPFAPSILREFTKHYATNKFIDEFMLHAVKVNEKYQKLTPAVVHIDGRARIQSVLPKNQTYYSLLKRLGKKTGIPVILNTSFNLPGEPIVETPTHAIEAFRNSHLQYIVLGRYIIKKKRNEV